jgi:hypothetical protein
VSFIGCELRVSRFNHWLPGGEAYLEVVQGTTEFHHEITDTLLPQAEPVFDDAAALDTTVGMLDLQSTLVQCLVRQVLLPGERLAAWLLGRHEALHLGQCASQEAESL